MHTYNETDNSKPWIVITMFIFGANGPGLDINFWNTILKIVLPKVNVLLDKDIWHICTKNQQNQMGTKFNLKTPERANIIYDILS